MSVYSINNVLVKNENFSLLIKKCDFKEGQIYAITGPNGCGKSTFLDMLSLAASPAEGTISFKDKDVTYENGELLVMRRQVAYLLQDPYLFNMSVEDNISYGLKIRNIPKADVAERSAEVMKLLSLSHLAKRTAHELSGGESQRVALARTLILDAEVFLLDEPTANVDKKNIGAIEDIITKLARDKNATVIFTTHSEKQAEGLSHNIMRMDAGRML